MEIVKETLKVDLLIVGARGYIPQPAKQDEQQSAYIILDHTLTALPDNIMARLNPFVESDQAKDYRIKLNQQNYFIDSFAIKNAHQQIIGSFVVLSDDVRYSKALLKYLLIAIIIGVVVFILCLGLGYIYLGWIENRLAKTTLALHESEEKYRTFFMESKDAVGIYNPRDNRLIDSNPAMVKLMRAKDAKAISELTITDLSSVYQPDGSLSEDKAKQMGKIALEKGSHFFEWMHKRLDGEEFFASVLLSKISIRGEIIFQAIVRDISKLKEQQRLLEQEKDWLERLVENKAQALVKAQRDLANAKRLSEIGTLGAMVAHELRNPLNVIGTAVFNIKRKKTGHALDSHIATIEKKVSESATIIDNLLSYAHIKMPRYEEVNIVKLVEEGIHHCEHKYDGQISILVRCYGKSTIKLKCDKMQIQEVIMNLLDNACQATPNRPNSIYFTIKENITTNKIYLVIRDEGDGIESSVLPNVFKPFYTTKPMGIGLGLNICKQMINLHNGLLKIKSLKSKGAQVLICLPTK